GNKGVVTAILPEEEMPRIDGIGPVDVVLSPIGMLNRMNLGQLGETHLGWVIRHGSDSVRSQLPEVFPASEVLDGSKLREWLKQAGVVDASGKVKVRLGSGGLETDQ